jgi:hypothetical protein
VKKGTAKMWGRGLWADSTAIVAIQRETAVAGVRDIDATRPADGVNCIIEGFVQT